MFTTPIRCLGVVACLGVIVALGGCNKNVVPPPKGGPPEVVVDKPIIREVGDYEDFNGRTEAIDSVIVRARVSGYLDKILFKNGDDISQGAALAEIDPRLFAASLEQGKASVAQAKAHADRLEKDYRRAQELAARNAISREELEKVQGDRAEATAAVAKAEAEEKLASIQLNYTKIIAPLSGRLGHRLVDPGNLVKADDTPLVTIVSLDPLYAEFDVDERTLLRLRRLIKEGKMTSARSSDVDVRIGLSDEEGFSRTGVIRFADNRVNPATGTLKVRAVMPNPDLLLSPGLFVRVRIQVGQPKKSLLVPEESLGSDQGQKFVYVMNDKQEAIYKRVKVGPQADAYRVIEEGIGPDDLVVVSGTQRIRPGSKATPTMREAKK
ncbi:MAG: efflux RND transporter periplasmic adaptor subunit [Gemmataceae bacterium]